ncbi:MAG TPA: hypothetical protein VLV86_14345 [Vicinamibacterales bacterium]|nr:hypothetical protein [Vicinamibacterales bacterium]
MATASSARFAVLAAIVGLASLACQVQLHRPKTMPSRMIEPQLDTSASRGQSAPSAMAIRLLDTQARGHIGRRVLHQQADGELVEDLVWRWSSAPDRYLDSALRLVLISRPDVRLVDDASAPALAVTLLAWQLESAGTPRLTGAIELQLTGADRVVLAEVVKESEPVSAALPGNLADASGRLLRRLAAEGITRMAASVKMAATPLNATTP